MTIGHVLDSTGFMVFSGMVVFGLIMLAVIGAVWHHLVNVTNRRAAVIEQLVADGRTTEQIEKIVKAIE